MNRTNHILLVRPASFGYNQETAESNAFQNKIDKDAEAVKNEAIAEFDAFAQKLRDNGVSVEIVQDTVAPIKPDAIFPNNWGSFHPDGRVILYPMCAPNRRIEKRPEILDQLREKFDIKELIDLSKYENENRFMEGTGSIVFHHRSKKAYACLSERTDKANFEEVCEILGYKAISFFSRDQKGFEIYHTNVMMCMASEYAIVCMESITDETERENVAMEILDSGQELIDVSYDQINQFAGNALEVANEKGESCLALSMSAYKALTDKQKEKIEKYSKFIPLEINTIETIGGGSARCMMAEIYLPKK